MATLIDLLGFLNSGAVPASPGVPGLPQAGAPQVPQPVPLSVPQMQNLPMQGAQTFPLDSAVDLTQGGQNVQTPSFNPAVQSPQPTPGIGGWQGLGFMKDLNADKNIQQAIMMAGLEMLKDRAPGESKTNAVAKAIQGGLGAYGVLEQRKQQNERLAKRDALEERNIDSQIKTRESSEKRAAEKAAIDLEVLQATKQNIIDEAADKAKNAKTKAELEDIKLEREQRLAQFEAKHPELQEASLRAELEMPQQRLLTEKARLDSERAQAQSARSRMSVDSANVKRLNAETEQQTLENDLVKNMTPEERKALKTKNSNASVPGDIQRAERYRANYEKANRAKLAKMTAEEKEAHLAQVENDFMTSSKQNATQLDMKIIETSDENSPEYKAAKQRLINRGEGKSAGATVPSVSARFARNPKTGKIERVTGE